jgi:hypothetical protein
MAIQEITNITINKGTDFSESFSIKQFDGNPLLLNDCTATSKIRKYPESSFYKSFDTSISPENGLITLYMSKENTVNLKTGRNYFDVLVSNGIETIKVIKGTMMVEDTASL